MEQENAIDQARSQAILIGSFTNPEAAQKMVKSKTPDFASTEEDVQKSVEIMRQINAEVDAQAATKAVLSHRRGRRKVLKE